MRDSLTVLAILLICLLTAALVAPHFVDFNAHRSLLEAKLSAAAGTRITVAGPIRIRLLPQPSFRFGQVTVGDATPGHQSLTAAELDVDVALAALLRGDVEVGAATLRSPRLDLALSPDGSVNLHLPGLGDPQRVRIERVVVTGGTLVLARPGRPTLTLAGLDFQGEATSLAGPFKAAGRFGAAKDRHAFRLSTGTFERNTLRVKLGLDASKTLPAIDVDGVASQGAAPPSGPSGPRFEGLATLKGALPLAANPATIPWTLSGHIKADGDMVVAGDLELRAGADMRALSATGAGELALGPDPHVSLRLHGPSLNLDALAVPQDRSTVAPPKGVELLSSLNRRLAQDDTPALPLKVDLDYGFDTLTTGPLTVLGLAGHVGLDGRTGAEIRLTANGPDTASITLDGRLEGGAAPVFRGRMTSRVRDLPRLADWLAPVMPAVSAWAKATIPARALSFEGGVEVSGVGVAMRDARLQLDQSQVAGTLSYTRAVGPERARLFADLTSDALDLDTLPDLGGVAGGFADLDLDVALAARAIKIVPAGIGAVDAGEIDLRLHKTADEAVLDQFSARLGSASLTATGRLDSQSATMDAHVDASQLDAIAGLLGRLMPGLPTAWLNARAPSLSPARLDLGLRAARSGDGTLLPTTLVVEGVMNGSRVKASLKPDTPGDFDPATALVSLDLSADAPQGLTLMRQFGLPAPPSVAELPSLGTGRVKARAHGSAAEGFLASIDASLGGTVLTFQGRTKPDHGTGHLSLKGTDLAPLLRAGGLLPNEGIWPVDAEADLAWHDSTLGFRHMRGMLGPVSFDGDLDAALSPPVLGQPDKPVLFGTLAFERLDAQALMGVALGPVIRAEPAPWSAQPFGAPPLPWPRAEIAVKVKSLGLGTGLDARDASFTFRTNRGAVTLADFTGMLRSGSLGGSLTLRRDGPLAAMSGTASWSGIDIDWPGLAGRVGGTFDFGGTGVSPAALVANLAGSGSVTIADGRISRLDPAALARAARAAEKDASGVDADEIREMIVPDLDRAALPLGDVAGQANLASGVFRIGPLRAVSGDWTADANAALDLKDFSFASKTVLQVDRPLPDWKGDPPQITLELDGPLDAPRREVDAAGFVNALQSRAIARDQERIDNLQQDINERGFFNRRLKAIEAEQAAAREKTKAEADSTAAIAEIQRQMRQNQDFSRQLAPLPTTRQAPKPPTQTGGKTSRAPGLKPLPGAASSLQPPPSILDPSSAGRY